MADKVKCIIYANFPVYESKSLFQAGKVKFKFYVSLLKLSTKDAMKLIPICFVDKKFDSGIQTIDEKTTAKCFFKKIETIINQKTNPKTHYSI